MTWEQGWDWGARDWKKGKLNPRHWNDERKFGHGYRAGWEWGEKHVKVDDKGQFDPTLRRLRRAANSPKPEDNMRYIGQFLAEALAMGEYEFSVPDGPHFAWSTLDWIVYVARIRHPDTKELLVDSR